MGPPVWVCVVAPPLSNTLWPLAPCPWGYFGVSAARKGKIWVQQEGRWGPGKISGHGFSQAPRVSAEQPRAKGQWHPCSKEVPRASG